MVASMGYKWQGGTDDDKEHHRGTRYRFDAARIVEIGRKRELTRTVALMVALYLVQWPLRLTALGVLNSARPIDPGVPARLSLFVDMGFLLTEIFVALRARRLVRSRRLGPEWLRCSFVGLVLVSIGAVLHFCGLVRLWFLLDVKDPAVVTFWLTPLQALWVQRAVPHGSAWYTACVDGRYSLFVAVISVTGLLLAMYPLLRRVPREEEAMFGTPEPVRSDDVVICCSGGGIRASAFSLGGLQVFQDAEIYEKASAVVGVSGGGYIAAAHHVVRWNVAKDKPYVGDWALAPDGMRAFSDGSPEVHWLRLHTKYLLDSVGTFTQAVLSLAFGIAVNLLLVAVAIGSAAWLLGWLFLASGRLHPWNRQDPLAGIGGAWPTGWSWQTFLWTAASYAWVLPAAGVGLFVLEKVIDRFWTLGVKGLARLRVPSRWLIWLGGAITLLVFVVPFAAEGLNQYVVSSASPSAWLLHQFGLVPEDVCEKVLRHGHAACGAATLEPDQRASLKAPFTVGTASLAAVVSAILAVLASATGAVTDKDGKSGPWAKLAAKVWARIKDPLVSYIAVTVILVVGVALFLREVSWLVTEEKKVHHWINALILTALLIVAKVFTDANRTSMHHFFRERIAEAFFVRRTGEAIDSIDYNVPLRFSQAAPGAGEGPRLVCCAVANVSDQDLVPSRRGCTPFVFGHSRMGLTDRLLPEVAARRDSSLYEFAADEFYRDVTIPAAVAMSAAALSPLAGRENVRVGPYRVVLALGNVRLGVWLPNPIWIDEWDLLKKMMRLGELREAAKIWVGISEDDRKRLSLPEKQREVLNLAAGQLGTESGVTVEYKPKLLRFNRFAARVTSIFHKPGMFSLIREAFGQASVFDRFLYVTDGGHYDNLGLIEALRRRPKEIYVLDASNEPEDTFRALGRAIATARIDLDCKLVMDPRGMRRLAQTRSGSAWCIGKYSYGNTGATPQEGKVYLAKAILLEGLPWDIETYAFENKQFPRTTAGSQLYSEFDFEAYRQLGSNAARALLESQDYKDARQVQT